MFKFKTLFPLVALALGVLAASAAYAQQSYRMTFQCRTDWPIAYISLFRGGSMTNASLSPGQRWEVSGVRRGDTYCMEPAYFNPTNCKHWPVEPYLHN
ncbi:hypothetical protein [Scleromatobacter humisilvae]|uniref:Secreted protein n=1 Tax=Scleromatobacter humisilvae TaxID=2897159 RepID=A0A9X1YM79_9BURK|nr:hypothetical protein [Scleromatobacter humisilvae]MCK9687313.1 hypothetical protein [Scleromatobacter humisilvae]